jgi:zinc protease
MRRRAFVLPIVLVAAAVGSADAKTTSLPPITKTTVGNGLTVYIMPTSRLPLVDFRLVVRAGAVNDPTGKEGLASLTADLLTQGAGERNAQQIAEDIAFVGGDLAASADAEQLVVTCEVMKKDFDHGLAMFRDVIVSPTFPEEEFERKKSEALAAIAASKDDPATVASTNLLPFLLGNSPLGHPAIGWEAGVQSLRREDVKRFHETMVTPENAVLAVVGDIDPKQVKKALDKAFKDWKKSKAERGSPYPPLLRDGGKRVEIVNKPEVTQTQIRLACVGVPRNHPDYYPIMVANTILGSGFTSRLVDEIRVNKGLTYSIRSGFTMYQAAGMFGVTTFTKNETIRQTIDETVAVIEKLRKDGPTEEELAKAKTYLTGLFPLGLQAPDNLAARLLDVAFYGLPEDYLTTYPDRMNAVTMEDCRRALKSYFCTDELNILVVSNPDVAKPALQGLGTIEVRELR